MRYLPIRSEKSVSAIAERVYSDLTPEKRKLAEAALIRENPQLKAFKGIKSGTLVKIPRLDDVEKTGERSTADPVADSVKEAQRELDLFSESLKAAFSKAQSDVAAAAATAKKAEFTKAMGSDPEAAAIAEKLKANLTQQAKDLKTQEKTTLDTLGKIGEALAKLDS